MNKFDWQADYEIKRAWIIRLFLEARRRKSIDIFNLACDMMKDEKINDRELNDIETAVEKELINVR